MSHPGVDFLAELLSERHKHGRRDLRALKAEIFGAASACGPDLLNTFISRPFRHRNFTCHHALSLGIVVPDDEALSSQHTAAGVQ
jgi:hypothetical protein